VGCGPALGGAGFADSAVSLVAQGARFAARPNNTSNTQTLLNPRKPIP
jgi:hypothetical protein